MNSEFTIFTGLANPALAKAIAHELGAGVSPCAVGRYPDGDVAVELLPRERYSCFDHFGHDVLSRRELGADLKPPR